MRKCKKSGFLVWRNVLTHMRENLGKRGEDRVIFFPEKNFNLVSFFHLIILRNSII